MASKTGDNKIKNRLDIDLYGYFRADQKKVNTTGV